MSKHMERKVGSLTRRSYRKLGALIPQRYKRAAEGWTLEMPPLLPAPSDVYRPSLGSTNPPADQVQ